MEIVCENCRNTIDDSNAICPFCGHSRIFEKTADAKIPRTIKELKEWYVETNLPPNNVTRFYIGKNLKRRKIFGIYKDEKTGKFIAYKNKDNGKRSIRYEGLDEKEAVREFYLRLKKEMNLQKVRAKHSKKRKSKLWQLLIIPPVLLFVLILKINMHTIKGEGYYQYNENYYYYIGSWYGYENGEWKTVDDSNIIDVLSENSSTYFKSKKYDSDYNIKEFPRKEYLEDSYYDTNTGSDNWDTSSSWDSSTTDWSSDW